MTIKEMIIATWKGLLLGTVAVTVIWLGAGVILLVLILLLL